MAVWGSTEQYWGATPPTLTYTDLAADIESWLMRDDIPTASLIRLAEAQLNRTLRCRQMIKRSTTTLDESYETLPVDCLAIRRLTLDGVPLDPITPRQLALWLDAEPTGTPTAYAVIGPQIQFAPGTASGTLELTYYAKLLGLSATQPTNGLLEWAYDVYLYGALLQAAPYLRDDARVPLWLAAYDRIVGQLNDSDDEAEYPGPLTIQTEGTVY